jgi:hypothetical protein
MVVTLVVKYSQLKLYLTWTSGMVNPHIQEKLLASNLTCILYRISWTISCFSDQSQFSLSQLLFIGLKIMQPQHIPAC